MSRLVSGPDNRKMIVDERTGEVLVEDTTDGVCVWVKRRELRNEHFVIAYQHDLLALASVDMSSACWKVLVYIMGSMKFQNSYELSNEQIADALKMHPVTVCTSIKRLTELSILQVIKNSRYSSYAQKRMNPGVAWKGRLDKLRKSMLEDFDNLVNSIEPDKLTNPSSID